ncbi:MAG: hypothetical protein ACRCYX_14810 [Dermatophilaceae bacterium]
MAHPHVRIRTLLALAAAGAAAVSFAAAPATATATEQREVLLRSAQEDTARDRASLPAQRLRVAGASNSWGYYVVTESSNRDDARRRGVTYSPKLANTRGTAAVQKARYVGGVLVVSATVDFAPVRVVEPGPNGFPPNRAEPGAVGRPGYSPLVELPNGTVINAPQVANATGRADKLLALRNGRAVFQETEGFYEGDEVYYVSFDSSAPDVAALEGVTYAPALTAAPGLGSNTRASARSGIAPFVNGQTGANNPERQGLNSALRGEGDPLNVIQTLAGDQDYSPLWDVHATAWTDAAAAAGANTRQDDFDSIERLAEDGVVTGPGGADWGAIGVIVNCPVISIEK